MHDPSAEAAIPENSVICGAVAYRGFGQENATKGRWKQGESDIDGRDKIAEKGEQLHDQEDRQTAGCGESNTSAHHEHAHDSTTAAW